MNPQRSYVRKIVYLVALVGLLLVLSWLGQPTSGDSAADAKEQGAGGFFQIHNLAELRNIHHLSEAQLGEIDPAGTTIKLATLGMRGVAANVLWEKANSYKMKKDWTNLSATLQQITLLEPHFLSVWRFQAWNLSYNVSAEFDDYRERYRWLIKGVDFLREGIRSNQHEPMLVWDVGWYVGHKIGVADESIQFRRLLKEDDETFRRWNDFRPVDDRDNWLVGKDWFARSEQLVDTGAPLRKTSPVIFFSNYPMAQMSYSEGLEKDGVFGERARIAWSKAGKDWFDYGARAMPSMDGTRSIHLNDAEQLDAEAANRVARLDAIEPGLRETIRKERYAALSAADRKSFETPPEKRSSADWQKAYEIEERLKVTHDQVARRIKGASEKGPLKLAREATDFERRAEEIRSNRNIVNFGYWRGRAQFEQAPEALSARENIYQGAQAMAAGDLLKARELYETGFAKWRLLFDRKDFSTLKNEESLGQDVVEMIYHYRRVLEKSDKPFPTDFALKDILKLHEKAYKERNGIK